MMSRMARVDSKAHPGVRRRVQNEVTKIERGTLRTTSERSTKHTRANDPAGNEHEEAKDELGDRALVVLALQAHRGHSSEQVNY